MVKRVERGRGKEVVREIEKQRERRRDRKKKEKEGDSKRGGGWRSGGDKQKTERKT